MFKKILIANRGEIALRVMRTCKRLGVQTVAIYSEADAEAPFVSEADEAHLVGGPRVNESYLNIEKIIEIAKQTGAEAIHPGYGLLSENATFAKRCEEEGITFIGPSPEVIERMGSKIESRRAMQAANIPVIPGTDAPVENEVEAIRKANEIGYPVMLKASAGGGGIGMQLVRNDDALKQAFAGNQQRAKSFFGDGTMYIEKYIENPRHIEIQILADEFGNTIHLMERECSIQRRHQKVLEEAPSVFLDVETRRKMGKDAVQAAKSIGYKNAGTIEFLVDENKNYYFLEMNTRLQVEHPITEEIIGLDLVEEQLKIAYGEKLSIQQGDVKHNGHAIEVRIYAEDPNTFFPSPGKITTFQVPKGDGIRHELAVAEGVTVTPFYDPMIAKLIVHAETRDKAIRKLQIALQDYVVEGIKTNILTLQKIVGHRAFEQGITTTDFIETIMKRK